ncbi:MAG TPA: hypothetical protein VM509_12300, partial [Planctomycetota bacterium]|nr:hypothetical protein [Planctomycetota bacterium]
EQSIASALTDRKAAFDRHMLSTLMSYMRAVALSVPFAETSAKSVAFESEFDVEGWAKDGYLRPLAEHRFDAPRQFIARTEPARRALILSKIATFGEHPSGLGKFTRTMFARDLRRTLEPVQHEVQAARASTR